MPRSSARSMITNESSCVVSGPKFIVPRHNSLTWRAVRPSRRYSIYVSLVMDRLRAPLPFGRCAVVSRSVSASGGRVEARRLVAVVAGVHGAPGRDDLVDAV